MYGAVPTTSGGRKSWRAGGLATAAVLLVAACGSPDKSGEFYTQWDLAGGCTSGLASAERYDANGDVQEVCDYAEDAWVWVTYAAQWCSVSQRQAPEVRRFSERSGPDVEVFTVLTGGADVSISATRRDAQSWSRAHGLRPSRVLYDVDHGGRVLPQHLLLGPDGRTWYRYIGSLSADEMQQLVDDFADGRREPRVREMPVR